MTAIASAQAEFVACELTALTFTGLTGAGANATRDCNKDTPPPKTDRKQGITQFLIGIATGRMKKWIGTQTVYAN